MESVTLQIVLNVVIGFLLVTSSVPESVVGQESACGSGICLNNTVCCPGELECCNDLDHCCGDNCCLHGYHCCNGNQRCCQSASSCCGDLCCPENSICCPNQNQCCPEGTQCCDTGCCPIGSDCCGDYCCKQDWKCCPNATGCYSDGFVCCGNGLACPVGSSCCGEHCCLEGFTCCSGKCCRQGSSCCGDECCQDAISPPSVPGTKSSSQDKPVYETQGGESTTRVDVRGQGPGTSHNIIDWSDISSWGYVLILPIALLIVFSILIMCCCWAKRDSQESTHIAKLETIYLKLKELVTKSV